MKMIFNLNSSFTFEFDEAAPKELFEQLGILQEIFGESECQKCHNTELRYVVREDKKKNKYYELRCLNTKCNAKLAFGVKKEGGNLFPKRKNSDNTYLVDRGWMRWDHTSQKMI